MEKVIKWLIDNWAAILPILVAIYELIVRVKPTNKSRSVVNIAALLFDKLIPNRSKGKGRFKLLNRKDD